MPQTHIEVDFKSDKNIRFRLPAAAGDIAAPAVTWLHEGKPSVSPLLVGAVVGLVSITAVGHLVTPLSAIVINAKSPKLRRQTFEVRNRREILRQFLIESMAISKIGGVAVLVLGVATSAVASFVINVILPFANWPATISLPAAFLVISFSLFFGVVFGYYPARKAFLTYPIDAMVQDG